MPRAPFRACSREVSAQLFEWRATQTKIMSTVLHANPNLVLATTILASSLAFIDGSVVNVGLPAIGRSLSRQLPRSISQPPSTGPIAPMTAPVAAQSRPSGYRLTAARLNAAM
jgi:hypothetical protein